MVELSAGGQPAVCLPAGPGTAVVRCGGTRCPPAAPRCGQADTAVPAGDAVRDPLLL